MIIKDKREQYSQDYVKQYDSFLTNVYGPIVDKDFTRREVNAYCASERCNRLTFGIKKNWRVRYIPKTVPKNTVICPSCDDYLYWSTVDPRNNKRP